MLVALPSHQGDIALLNRLMRWLRCLDGTLKNHDALLAFDAGTPFDLAMEAQHTAEEIFREVRVFSTDKHYSGWPVACNQMFHAVSKWAFEHGTKDFLLMEPDAVPLSKGWLDRIEWDYRASGKRWMGQIEDCQMPLMPSRVMSGVAVYCGDTAARIQDTSASGRPWNTDASAVTVPDGEHTLLIRDFFGTRERPPVFVESKTPTSPSHHFTLDWLPGEAVIFHRDKQHSLIPLLANKLGIEWADEAPTVVKPRLAVVFPVHQGDLNLALQHALWLRKMGRKWNNRAVIAHDPFASRPALAQLHAHLSQCFAEVEMWRYGVPPVRHYPWAANFMFQSVARKMYEQDSPWLLCEADAILLTPDALDQIEAEYYRAAKGWMGAVVPGLDHFNGTAVYPPDAAARMPAAMSRMEGAFDMHAREDTLHDRHDASHLLFHVWSLVNRMACPTGGGEVPMRITAAELRQWLPRSAVFLHRVKDNSVLNLLLTGQYQHQ